MSFCSLTSNTVCIMNSFVLLRPTSRYSWCTFLNDLIRTEDELKLKFMVESMWVITKVQKFSCQTRDDWWWLTLSHASVAPWHTDSYDSNVSLRRGWVELRWVELILAPGWVELILAPGGTWPLDLNRVPENFHTHCNRSGSASLVK